MSKRGLRLRQTACLVALLAAATLASYGIAAYQRDGNEFQFVILGDRTGEAVPGVYEQAWRETAADQPDFVISVGDTIEGGDDLTMDAEWQKVFEMLAPYRRFRMFFTPGNHDVWSIASGQAFEKYTKHPLHYSFDYKQAHFTVLDNSRGDHLPAEEIAYLQKDLEMHAKQPVKFIFFHRPSWVLYALIGDPQFSLHRLAKRYGVQYLIAGHLHQMLHFEIEGVTYLSMASSGGHLRVSKAYKDGWFFQHTLATVQGSSVDLQIKELGAPFGEARVSKPADWGSAGLVKDSSK